MSSDVVVVKPKDIVRDNNKLIGCLGAQSEAIKRLDGNPALRRVEVQGGRTTLRDKRVANTFVCIEIDPEDPSLKEKHTDEF